MKIMSHDYRLDVRVTSLRQEDYYSSAFDGGDLVAINLFVS